VSHNLPKNEMNASVFSNGRTRQGIEAESPKRDGMRAVGLATDSPVALRHAAKKYSDHTNFYNATRVSLVR
jgi:hypothetical protein